MLLLNSWDSSDGSEISKDFKLRLDEDTSKVIKNSFKNNTKNNNKEHNNNNNNKGVQCDKNKNFEYIHNFINNISPEKRKETYELIKKIKNGLIIK